MHCVCMLIILLNANLSQGNFYTAKFQKALNEMK